MNALLALSFTAGVLAPVNPCGFALLPTYLSHTLTDRPDAPLPRRVGQAVITGIALAVGFAVSLGGAGLAISAGARPLIQAAPWLGLLVGIVLLLLGAIAVTGRAPRLRLPDLRTRAARSTRGPLQWALFGVGYAAASLACTFGVLLAVIAQAETSRSLAGQVVVFAAYASGSVALLVVLSVAAAVAGAALTRYARALGRRHTVITAVLMMITGVYLIGYWLPAATGRSLTGRGLPSIDRWSATTSTWLQGHTIVIVVAALIAVVGTVSAVVAFRPTRKAETVESQRD